AVTFARALLAQGKTKAASEIFSNAEKSFGKQNRFPTLFRHVVSARIKAADGKTTDAIELLNTTFAEARKLGYLLPQFEARLAMGQIEIDSGKTAAGRNRLSELAREARIRGYLHTARLAARTS
ncbi:MAG: hypothetical protein HY646_14505, partial [Acidobacteria bacterium]|nr:hypothetical protein [Acidobacteriota bacterium]